MTTTTKGGVYCNVQVTEYLSLGTSGFDTAETPSVSWAINSSPSESYGPNTTIVPDAVYAATVTLSAGAYTLNVASLSRTGLSTVDMTGLKPLAVHFQCPSTNTHAVVIAPGASNGYDEFGAGLKLAPGSECVMHIPSGTAFASGDRTLDFSSSMAAAVVNVLIWARV